MIKTILALAEDTPALEATLAAAVEIGRRFDAHLDVLHVGPDAAGFLPLDGDGISAGMIETIRKTAESASAQRAGRVRETYERLCAGSGLSSAWHLAAGWEPDIAAAAGRLRDLIVVGPPAWPADSLSRRTLHALLFDSGRPVLLLPSGLPPIFGAHVALAWNGSAQAARATAAALPFLRLAERTSILTARAIDPHASAAELAETLGRHGIEAVGRNFEPTYLPVGQALLDQSHRSQASLLVMGAYSHSRLRELNLGGATREVLAVADRPVLMAH